MWLTIENAANASLAWDLAWHEYLYESVFAYVWVCLFAFVCFCQYSCEMLSVVLGRGAFPHPDLSSSVVHTGKHLSVKNSPHHIVNNMNNVNNNNNNKSNPKLHPNPNCHTDISSSYKQAHLTTAYFSFLELIFLLISKDYHLMGCIYKIKPKMDTKPIKLILNKNDQRTKNYYMVHNQVKIMVTY